MSGRLPGSTVNKGDVLNHNSTKAPSDASSASRSEGRALHSTDLVTGAEKGDGHPGHHARVDLPDDIEVSVVMPCLNEAAAVGTCVEKARRGLAAFEGRSEIIVVDNGSSDGSPEIAAAAGARVVHEAVPGYGAAYLRGFSEARGRYIVMGDSDDTYDFLAIPEFVAPLQGGNCDLVMGSRFLGEILPGAMSWSHQYVGNPILSGMLRMLFSTTVSDSHCGMRSFTREAYRRMRLRTTGMEMASEIVINSLREGLRISEIPIKYYPRKGESKLNDFSDAWRHIRFLLMYSPSYLFQLPGLFLVLVGTVLTLSLARGTLEAFGRTWSYHVMMFGAGAVILGYNLIIFDTLAKVYSIGAGFRRSTATFERIMRIFSLERGLVVGTLLLLIGLGIETKVVFDWWTSGRGALMAVPQISLGMASMVVGTQTVFASFLISLLLIRHV